MKRIAAFLLAAVVLFSMSYWLVSKAEADELRAILNAATADDRKAFVERFGCRPGDLPALEFPKAKDWLSDLEAVQS